MVLCLQEYEYFKYGRLWLCVGLQLKLIISMKGQQEEGEENKNGQGDRRVPSPLGVPLAYLVPVAIFLCNLNNYGTLHKLLSDS